MTPRLTALQARFVNEYMIDCNGSAAARRAGYSARSCRVQASQLLRHPVVGPCVRDGLAELLAEVKGSAAHTLRERAKVAYFDPIVLFDENGALLRVHQMDAATRAMLSVRVEERSSGPVLRYAPASREAAFRALERAQKAARDDSVREMQDCAEEPLPAAPAVRVPPVIVVPPIRVAPFPQAVQPLPARAQPEAPAPVPPFPEGPNPNPPPPMPEPPKPPEGDPGIVPVRRDPGTPAPERPIPEDDPSINPPRKEPGQAPPQHARFERDVQALMTGDPKLKNNGDQAQGTPKPRVQEGEYDFRKDPDWMWGGRRKPTPEPEPSPALLEHLQNVAAAAQRAELMGGARPAASERAVIRPGTILAKPDPGYNPPWARPGYGRPQYAIGAGECSLDGYGRDDDILE
jgi:hypothetical protein